jgi:hypothetical protein
MINGAEFGSVEFEEPPRPRHNKRHEVVVLQCHNVRATDCGFGFGFGVGVELGFWV